MIVVYLEVDSDVFYLRQVSDFVFLGNVMVKEFYLDVDKMFWFVFVVGVDVVYFGYGFFSENIEFVQRCEEYGVVFIGLRVKMIRDFGLKYEVRRLVIVVGVFVVEGSELFVLCDEVVFEVKCIGYLVMLKVVVGGGGIGMKVCENEVGFCEVFIQVLCLVDNNFSDGGVFFECFIVWVWYVEV